MRNLAEELSVRATSLYNHVANKDDIIDGIVDLVVGEIELPGGGPDWKSVMRRRATSAHEVLLRHPWATLQIVSRVNAGPSMLAYIEATLDTLVAAGFTLEMADHARNAMDNHIYGFTLQELSFPFEDEEYGDAAASRLSLIPADRYPRFNSLAHMVIDGHYSGLHHFEFGLELILQGLEGYRQTT